MLSSKPAEPGAEISTEVIDLVFVMTNALHWSTNTRVIQQRRQSPKKLEHWPYYTFIVKNRIILTNIGSACINKRSISIWFFYKLEFIRLELCTNHSNWLWRHTSHQQFFWQCWLGVESLNIVDEIFILHWKLSCGHTIQFRKKPCL